MLEPPRVRTQIKGIREYRSRRVMESYLGRKLRSDEYVHHINHDTMDDRIENLELTTPSEHTFNHNKGKK